ncbi:MAG TPA: S-methyl-5-thioribose-1-phosphate isomerase [Pseudobdellovibrionaceae bacterium]|nr:S-methyl-5-thioribose-1-phosphate isomerase [Pseudobdellovibrionaceae bacterium]
MSANLNANLGSNLGSNFDLNSIELKGLSLRLLQGRLSILDQRHLPFKETWVEIQSLEHMVELIKGLAIRGAPLIGVSAALALAQLGSKVQSEEEFFHIYTELRNSRPTAVNLMNALDEMKKSAQEFLSQKKSNLSQDQKWADVLWKQALKLYNEDIQLCENMADKGSLLIQDGDQILTHCNTGGLATVGRGTALGVIHKAHTQNKKIHVWVDETRPLFQGSRLTAWELNHLRIPHTLICDNMAASLMAQGKVHKIFVGADRIARNGDAANKIGTYSLAVLAKYHQIPFYVVAPQTTLDPHCATGKDIPIELRDSSEVLLDRGSPETATYNPAFDVTPNSLITQIIWG